MTERAAAAPGDGPVTALERLSARLDERAYATDLVTLPGGRARLRVTNRAATALAESIYCDDRWYLWSWAERIALVSDVATAAEVIARVLADRRTGT